MSLPVKVYEVRPAEEDTAAWLRRALAPIAAARFARAPPVEMRPTGKWGGWAGARDTAPDGRVAVSNRVRFWSARSVLSMYIHEGCHSLIHDVQGADSAHDCVFFSLSYALRFRCDSHEQLQSQPFSLTSDLSLYDLSDLPSIDLGPDLGWCVTWSTELAEQMAASDLSAEAIAVQIVKRYHEWLDQLRDQPRLDKIAARQAARQANGKAVVAQVMTDKLFISNCVAVFSTVLLVLISVMLLCR